MRLLVTLALAISVLLAGVDPLPVRATAGGLTLNLSSGGTVRTALSARNDQVHALAIQPDGKLVVVGTSTGNASLARYLPNGTLDVTFGTGGTATLNLGGIETETATSLAIQSDGKLVVTVGPIERPGTSLISRVLLRYLPNGALDLTFGDRGMVTSVTFNAPGTNLSAVAFQPDGKLVVAANMGFEDFSWSVLSRYLPNGAVDSTFNSGSSSILTLFANAVLVQPDGKLVMAGSGSGSMALVRYLPDGTVDTTFGTGGRVSTGIVGSDHTKAVALQADGKLVVAGTTDPVQTGDFAVARYLPNGMLDLTFGTAGRVTTDFGGNDIANALVVQPDGKLVVAGITGPIQPRDFAVARYLQNGMLDPTFGTGGKITADLGGEDEIATSLALQADGKLIVAGYGGPITNRDFLLARYLPSGVLDESFGADFLGSVGGRSLGITPRTSEVYLSWIGGGQQAGYYVARSPQAGAMLSERGAYFFTDVAPAYDRNLNCYVLVPLGTSGPLGASDALCAQLGLRTSFGEPQDFTLRLNQSATTSLNWFEVGGQIGYVLLAVPLDGTAPRVVGLPGEASNTTDATGGVPTCYQLYAIYSWGITQTDLVCGVPGVSTNPIMQSTAPAAAESPPVRAATAAQPKLPGLLQAGKTKVEQEAGKLRRKGR